MEEEEHVSANAAVDPFPAVLGCSAPSLPVLPLLLAGALVWTGCSPRGGPSPRLLAYVGTAAAPAVEVCTADFTSSTGIEVMVEQGSSGSLLARLELAGRGDLYIPGSPDYQLRARDEGLILDESVTRLAFLVPSIAVPMGNPARIRSLDDLAAPGTRVGLGDPSSVCVGAYGVEILESAGLGERVRPNVVTHAPSCSGTAGLVALRTVDAALGWRVFTGWNPSRIEIVPIAPERLPRLGEIPAAITAVSEHADVAAQLIAHLAGPACQEVFEERGYLVSETEARVHAPDASIGGVYDPPAGWL